MTAAALFILCTCLFILVHTMWMLVHACSYLFILCTMYLLVYTCSCILWPLGQTVHILLYICVAWIANNFWQVCTHGQKINGIILVAFCRNPQILLTKNNFAKKSLAKMGDTTPPPKNRKLPMIFAIKWSIIGPKIPVFGWIIPSESWVTLSPLTENHSAKRTLAE